MALGIFDKVSLIVKSNVHDLLDRAIDANSIPAHEQLIRELEKAIQTESTEQIKAEVQVNSLHTKITAIQKQIDEFNASAETILSDDDPTNDSQAETLLNHVIELEGERDELAASEAATSENHKMLANTVEKMRQRHTKLVKDLKELRRVTSQAKSDQTALNAVRKVNNLVEGVDAAHLGGAIDRAKEKSAVARAELRQAVGTIQDTPEAILQRSQAQQRVAALKAKLSGQSQTT